MGFVVMKALGRGRAGFRTGTAGEVGRRARRLGRETGLGPCGLRPVLGQLWPLTPVCLCSLAADLAECKLVSFPIGIYKVLRNVTDQIHLITLANNELKSLTSKFMTTFCQLRGRLWLVQARGPPWLALILQVCDQGQSPGSWTREIIPKGSL